MIVSIWTDALALFGGGSFNRVMRRQVPLVLALVAVMGLFVWWMSNANNGPEVTGPVGSEVRVSEVEDVWALPAGFRQLLGRDAIAPIYDPTFTTAEASSWPDDTLVVGVEINGDARAYPVGPLNRREMVIDTVGDIPVLVSW